MATPEDRLATLEGQLTELTNKADRRIGELATQIDALQATVGDNDLGITNIQASIEQLKETFAGQVAFINSRVDTVEKSIPPGMMGGSSTQAQQQPPPQQQQQQTHHDEHVKPLHDLRVIQSINKLKNDKHKYDKWARRIINAAAISYPYAESVMNQAGNFTNEIIMNVHFPQSQNIKLSRELYSIMQATIDEDCEAEDIFNTVDVGAGLEAWRLIKIRYDPHDTATESAKLTAVLKPQQTKNMKDLIKDIDDWKRRVSKLTGANKTSMDNDNLRSTIITSMCPDELQRHLKINGRTYNTSALIYDEIVRYTSEMNVKSDGKVKSTPMEVDLVDRDGASDSTHDESGHEESGCSGGSIDAFGKGDSKGKGKGRENVTCHYCGEKGHFKDECPKNPQSKNYKGAGKGHGQYGGQYGGKGYGKGNGKGFKGYGWGNGWIGNGGGWNKGSWGKGKGKGLRLTGSMGR